MSNNIFTVRLADLGIRIQSVYPHMREFCREYLCDSVKPELSVNMDENKIEAERDNTPENSYSSEYLETLAVLREIAEQLPGYDRFLFHGASITYKKQGFLFTAPSGTGKTTHIRLWKKCLGDAVDIVNGDKPILSVETTGVSENQAEKVCVRVYGTPWAGKENWQKNCAADLCGICFVKRGQTNRISRLKPENCLDMLFRQVYLPGNGEAAGRTLELLDKMVNHVPLYLLECDMSEEAVKCSFEALTGLSYEVHKGNI